MRWFVLLLLALMAARHPIAEIAHTYLRRSELPHSLFAPELAAARDPCRFKAYLTSRRAGKTTCILTDFLERGLGRPGTHYAYVALTQSHAEGIAWPILHELDLRHNLRADFNEAKLRMTLPGGSTLKLHGADRARWAYRLLGHKLGGIAIDEAGFYSIDLKWFIDECARNTLTDLQGVMILGSTPGHIPAGLFYRITEVGVPGWSVHRWSALDNPYVSAQVAAEIAELKRDNPDIEKTPSYIRNYLGRWVTEIGERVYRFDFTTGRNSIAAWNPRELGLEDGWRFILGLDLGWRPSATGFSAIAWHRDHPRVYALEQYRQFEMSLSDVAARCQMYMDYYPGLLIVGDPGHRQSFEELRRRNNLPCIEANKAGKVDWIEALNSDLDAGRFLVVAPESSLLAEEWVDLVWERRPDGSLIECPRVLNDVADATLYAYREAYHYRYKQEERAPERGTAAAIAAEEMKIEQTLLDRLSGSERGMFDV